MSTYGADANPDTNKIRQVAFCDRIAPQPTLKVDQHSTGNSDKCYHLVERIGSTNVWVLVDPASIPHP